MTEKTINFKIDEELYKQVKVKIAQQGMTLKDYMIQLIKNNLESKE